MNRIIRFCTGFLKLRVVGADLNRFLNLCAAQNIPFWGHTRLSHDTMILSISSNAFFAMPQIARRSFCRVRILSRHGLPFLFLRIKPRGALLSGGVLFLFCAFISSSFLWNITISAPESISHEEIRSALGRYGVTRGAYLANLDLDYIRTRMLIDLPHLIYCNINLHGSNATVTVRKRTRPPGIVNESGFANIVAKQGGIVERIVVQEGTPEVKKGDLVLPGQILANGYMTGRNGVTVTTRARADVYARTWDKTKAIFPLSAFEIQKSEAKRTCYTLLFGKRRIKIFEKGSIALSECDKIVVVNRLTLPFGIVLPIALERETAQECALTPSKLAPISAIEIVTKELEAHLALADTDSLVDCRFSAQESGDAILVEMTAECIKQIGTEQTPKGE